MYYEELLVRLRAYAPPRGRSDAERAEAAAAIECLTRENAELQSDLAAARAERDTCRANFIHETQQLAAALALLLEARNKMQRMMNDGEWYDPQGMVDRIDAALAGKDAT